MRTAFGDRALLLDVPQDIEGIDLGPSPTPYERAEQLAAAAYGARRTWFLTNGATQGNHALCLALAPTGTSVVLQRNSHASMVDGLVLSGGTPSWVAPSTTPSSGWRTASPRRRSRRHWRATRRRAPRSSSRPPTTGWRPTLRRAPRSPTRPARR